MTVFRYVNDFAAKYSLELRNILGAQKPTEELLQRIESSLPSDGVPMFSSDVDLVVFGSLARGECTVLSDIDWTILVDGQANPEHYTVSNIVRNSLRKANLIEPGTSGMFGQVSFSHDLIHYIGGEDDTNHNISRRILLLLESARVFVGSTEQDGTAYDRVIRGIVNEYITNDSGFQSSAGQKARVPRFLLNDIIRFWRTMCVDFAFKQKSQIGEKWALRNIKLRLSRKLIYIKGLLMCFSCFESQAELRSALFDLSMMKPLDVVIKVLLDADVNPSDISNLLTAYDEFLGILNDNEKRNHLASLPIRDSYKDGLFLEAREISERFQNTLTKLFLVNEGKLKEFSFKYGVF